VPLRSDVAILYYLASLVCCCDPPCPFPVHWVQTSEETVFKVKRVTKMSRVCDAYAAKKGVARTSIRFLFDGERINDEDTPESVRVWTG
jgi:hypothetical protein